MNNAIEPITFENRNGRRLFGMLHTPAAKRSQYGLVILSPGIKSRVAPHRMYVKMAERFCAMGFVVLRVDPEGLGDSEGEIMEKWTADVYCSMELGRLVDDTVDTLDWMQQQTGCDRFILAGLCGGAITALLTADRDARVDAILSLGMTCILASSNIDPAKYLTTKQLDSIREKYLKKILNPEALLRFVTFKSDYRLLIKSLIAPLKKKPAPPPANPAPDDKDAAAAGGPMNSNLNPHFPKAFEKFISQNKILLIFSEADRLYWEFEEKYLQHYGDAIKPYQANYDIQIVADANHIFSFRKWQDEMLAISSQWLERHYG